VFATAHKHRCEGAELLQLHLSCEPEDAWVLARHPLPELDEHDLTRLAAGTLPAA
jgi:hypothetical protein